MRFSFNQEHPSPSAFISLSPKYLPLLFHFPPCPSSVYTSIFSSVYLSSFFLSGFHTSCGILLTFIRQKCPWHCNLFLSLVFIVLVLTHILNLISSPSYYVWGTLVDVHIFDYWFLADLHVLGSGESKIYKFSRVFDSQYVSLWRQYLLNKPT